MSGQLHRFTVGLTEAQRAEADALAGKLSEERGGKWSRADVIREALRELAKACVSLWHGRIYVEQGGRVHSVSPGDAEELVAAGWNLVRTALVREASVVACEEVESRTAESVCQVLERMIGDRHV